MTRLWLCNKLEEVKERDGLDTIPAPLSMIHE